MRRSSILALAVLASACSTATSVPLPAPGAAPAPTDSGAYDVVIEGAASSMAPATAGAQATWEFAATALSP